MNHCTKEDLIGFEDRIKVLFTEGELPFLLHLCGGNEEQLIEIFRDIQPGDWIFSGHRSHYHYLLAGGDPFLLERKILDGDSMFVFGKQGDGKTTPWRLQCNFLTSSVLAGTCCIAAGVALAIKMESLQTATGRMPHVWCFLGDGAEDEGHFYEAARFVEGHGLPCTFIIEDNDRSVDTNRVDRHGQFLASNHPWLCVKRYRYTPTYPHAGAGLKTMIQFKPEAVQRFLNQRNPRDAGATQ